MSFPIRDRVSDVRRHLVAQVHESALIVAGNFTPFYDAYREWITRGFSADPERLKRPPGKTRKSTRN